MGFDTIEINLVALEINEQLTQNPKENVESFVVNALK